jgi:hypothetical protein
VRLPCAKVVAIETVKMADTISARAPVKRWNRIFIEKLGLSVSYVDCFLCLL